MDTLCKNTGQSLSTEFLEAEWNSQPYRLALLARFTDKENMKAAPLLFWFTGFRSNMRGKKAERVDQWAVRKGLGFVRFDYSGHGESEGCFEECTISRWLSDALHVITQSGQKNILIIGSSMGGWLAILVARLLKEQRPDILITGLVLLAPAVNLTEELIWKRLPMNYQETLKKQGRIMLPYPDDKNLVPISEELIEDGQKYLLYKDFLVLDTSIHIIQGKQDETVPWHMAQTLFENLPQDPVRLTFINDATHHLEREQDLEILEKALEDMLEEAG